MFIQISTDEVFWSLKDNQPAFVEENRYKPISPYPASKASGDMICRAYNKTYGMPIIVINCSNNFGPRQFPEKLKPSTIRNAIKGDDIQIYSDGQQIRDWIYVDDHTCAISSILKRQNNGLQYNIGGDNQIRNIDLVNQICKILDEVRPHF